MIICNMIVQIPDNSNRHHRSYGPFALEKEWAVQSWKVGLEDQSVPKKTVEREKQDGTAKQMA